MQQQHRGDHEEKGEAMKDARQTPAGRHVTARVVVGMTETEYARWRRDHRRAR
jgi:hypothetical protein